LVKKWPLNKVKKKNISFFKPKQCLNFDEFDKKIDLYLNTIEGKANPDPLLFCKFHESQFPQLAKPAKKYLLVSASCEVIIQLFWSYFNH
jgi:hypothetical protein